MSERVQTLSRYCHKADSKYLFFVVRTAALVMTSSLMLSWVAVYNEAPLVFSDTLAYAMSAHQREMPGFFSIFYSIYILPLHQGVTFWPVIFVQGAMLSHAMYTALGCSLGRRIECREFLLIVLGLCIFSSAPWVSGQLLPDVFTPIILLCMYLVVFCRDRLTSGQLIYFVILLAASITTHLSHAPIALGLAVLCLTLHTAWGGFRRFAANAAAVLLPCLCAIGIMLAINAAASSTPGLAKNSNVFLLAKLIDEGHALKYLRSACPSAGYRLCGSLDELTGLSHDDLKWDEDSPLRKHGSFDDLEPEARSIVWQTLLRYPTPIIASSAWDAARQLTRFQAGDGLSPEFATLVGKHLGDLFGSEVGAVFLLSKQAQGRLPIRWARSFHGFGLVGAIVALTISLLYLARDAPSRLVLLVVFIVVGVLWNALVTGALSGAYDRYLARIIWLIPFVASAAVLSAYRALRSDLVK